MGLFSRPSDSSTDDQQTGESAAPKENLYQRYDNARSGRNNKFSDEELEKYTGKSRVELEKWAETTPGVGKNQLSIAAASKPGIAGDLAAGAGPLGTNTARDFSKK